jgi:hypothetical protein
MAELSLTKNDLTRQDVTFHQMHGDSMQLLQMHAAIEWNTLEKEENIRKG